MAQPCGMWCCVCGVVYVVLCMWCCVCIHNTCGVCIHNTYITHKLHTNIIIVIIIFIIIINTNIIRFAPEANHGANAGLAVARELLEPIKKRYPFISYADLYTLAGVVAIEEVGVLGYMLGVGVLWLVRTCMPAHPPYTLHTRHTYTPYTPTIYPTHPSH